MEDEANRQTQKPAYDEGDSWGTKSCEGLSSTLGNLKYEMHARSQTHAQKRPARI